jgi:hypothetical protein
MSSWRLLRHITPFWGSSLENAIFLREITRPPVWKQYSATASRLVGPFLVLLVLLSLLGSQLSSPLLFCLNGSTCLLLPLVALAPSLLLWVLPLGLTLAPVVVLERERHTWDTLRMAPLNIEMILLSKTEGVLWWLRHLIRNMRVVLVLTSLGVGLISLTLIDNTFATDSSSIEPEGMCGIALGLMFVAAFIFLIDRAQQFVLMAVSALAVSATAPTLRVALPVASVATFFAWLADIGLAAILLALQPHHTLRFLELRAMALIILGPAAAFMIELAILPALAHIIGALIVREIAIRVLWRWTVHAAQTQ